MGGKREGTGQQVLSEGPRTASALCGVFFFFLNTVDPGSPPVCMCVCACVRVCIIAVNHRAIQRFRAVRGLLLSQ